MPTQRPFLFDIGNVLCTFDYEPMLGALRAQSTELGADPLRRFAETKDLYETGKWGDDEFITHVSDAIGFRLDRDEFVRIWTSVFKENAPMTRVVRGLHAAGHPLFLLSNTNGLHLRYLVDTLPVFELFAGGVYSHEAGSIKPEPLIYEAAISRFSIDPEEAFYIDDLPANISTGERLGLISHRYDVANHDAFERWLESHGVAFETSP